MAAPVEELDAVGLLEEAHLGRDRGLADVQQAAPAGEAPGAGDRMEGTSAGSGAWFSVFLSGWNGANKTIGSIVGRGATLLDPGRRAGGSTRRLGGEVVASLPQPGRDPLRAGAIEELPAQLDAASHVLVTFPEAAGLGLVGRMRAILGDRLLAVIDRIEPNPE
jgi:hypothetical protein